MLEDIKDKQKPQSKFTSHSPLYKDKLGKYMLTSDWYSRTQGLRPLC